MLNTISSTTIASHQNEPEDKILACYNRKGFFVKMLVEPDRFYQRISSLKSGQERLKTEISELTERGCVQVASVSYISPELNFELFRDIGLLLDLNKEDVRSIFRRDVETRVLSVDGIPCMWCKDKKSFVIYYSLKPTESNGDFHTFEDKHDKVNNIEELMKEKNNGYGHNECVVKYTKDQIKALIVDTKRYYTKNLTLDEILDDCKPIIGELKQTLTLDLDVYLYNPDTGELVRSENRKT